MSTRPVVPAASAACRRLRAAVIALAVAGLVATILAGCTAAAPTGAHDRGGRVPPAGERMPAPPSTEAAWLAQVRHIYATADGGGAVAWLRRRMARRRPGVRLAVVMGIDDVMVETHFRGTGTLVEPSVRFARAAHRLGYSIFYVTGRSWASGLGDVEATLERAGVPANGFYGRPVGAPDVEAGKSQVRAAIARQGYTLAMGVAASEASFDGRPRPEREVRLPEFSLPG